MGDIGDFFQDIVDGVSDFFQDVIDELGDIIEDIGDFFEEYWEELLVGTFVAVLVFTPLGGVVLSGLSEMSAWIWEETLFFLEAPLTGLSKWTMTLQDFWYTFSEFVHLKAILAIHNIATVVSPEYNKMVSDFYKTIAEWSYSFGAGALGVASIIQNTRTLVFDVSSTFGMSYDMCELVWINDLAAISQLLGEKASEYSRKPEQLILDLQEEIQRPKIEAKQGFLGSVYGSLEGTINLLDTTASHLEILANDVFRLFDELPDWVETDWTEDIVESSSEVIEYIESQFDTEIKALKDYINTVWGAFVPIQTLSRENQTYIQNPGNLLKNTKLLVEPNKSDQYQKIYEESNQQLISDLPNVEKDIEKSYKRLESIEDALQNQPPLKTVLPTEMQGLSYPVGSKPTKKKTSWFVGDY